MRKVGAGACAYVRGDERLCVKRGDSVERGDALLTLYAETASELDYALDYAESVGGPMVVGE